MSLVGSESAAGFPVWTLQSVEEDVPSVPMTLVLAAAGEKSVLFLGSDQLVRSAVVQKSRLEATQDSWMELRLPEVAKQELKNSVVYCWWFCARSLGTFGEFSA